MKALFKYSILPFLVIILSTTNSKSNEWKLAKDKDDIQVYTKVSGDSKLKDSKVTSIFNVSANELLKLLVDFDDYADWIPSCKESKQLKKINDNEYYYYSEYKAPWPVANRDMIVHVSVGTDPSTGIMTLTMNGAPDYIPEKDKIIRIPEFVGSWILKPLGENKVEATNEYHTDPGGGIPEWLANMTAVDNPYKMMIKMKELLNGE